jgi:hypothetical protein
MHRVLSVDVGTANYAICACTFSPMPTLVLVDIWRLGDTKAVSASSLVDRLIERWQSCSLFSQGWVPDTVVIEQQMRGAHINLALAFSTYAFFKTRYPDTNTKFVNPLAKFKAYRKTQLEVAPRFTETPPRSYLARKREAVAIADAILAKHNERSLASFCEGKPWKLDDIADAFLQTFCY